MNKNEKINQIKNDISFFQERYEQCNDDIDKKKIINSYIENLKKDLQKLRTK